MKDLIKFSALVFIFNYCFFFTVSVFANNEEMIKNEAMTKIKSVLKDPDSAKFQNLEIVTNSKSQESVCGEVNARNSFGGYTGFSKFSYTGGSAAILDENSDVIHQYKLAGCAGPEAELEARLQNEADFNCNVIWNLLVNNIVNNEDRDSALNAAIDAIKSRAIENGGTILPEQEKAIRVQFDASLEQTLSDKKQVKAIKRDQKYQGLIFVKTCSANTLNLLKAQMGIK